MNQLSIFDMPAARAAGVMASEQCAAKAERTTSFSTHLAREWVLKHLDAHGPTSGENLVDRMKAAGHVPHDDRAFGSVFQSLARERRIEKAGYVERRKGHSTGGGLLWRIAR